MKIETTARQLQSAFKLLGSVISGRSAYPVLGCVKFDGNHISGTNLDQTLVVPVAATAADGATCIEFRMLRRLVSHIPGDDVVSIRAGKDGSAELRFSRGRYDMPTIDADSFATDRWDPAGDAASCEGIADAARFVRPSISAEETRYYLSGMCFSTDQDGHGCVVATNGHQMSVAPAAFVADWMQGLILPCDAVAFLADMPDPLTMERGEKGRLRFSWNGGVKLTTKSIEGTFPDWKRVLPKIEETTPSITLDRKQFAAALFRAQQVAFGDQPCVTLSFTDGSAAVVAGNDAFGREYLADAAGTNAADPQLVAFDAKKMRSLLAGMAGDTVRIAAASGGHPMRITAAGEKPWCVLMPMRGGNEKLALDALTDIAPAEVARAA